MTFAQKKGEGNTARPNWNRFAIAAVGLGVVSSCNTVLDYDRKYDGRMAELKGSEDYAAVRNLDNAANELGRARDFTGAAAPDCPERLQRAKTSLLAATDSAKGVRIGAHELAGKLKPELCSGNKDTVHELSSEAEELGRKEAQSDPKARAVEASVGREIHDQAVFRIGMMCLVALGLAIAGMFRKPEA